jgi:ribosome biogenesis protein Tsr3
MNFIQVNLEPLTLYSTASNEDEMKTMEADFF